MRKNILIIGLSGLMVVSLMTIFVTNVHASNDVSKNKIEEMSDKQKEEYVNSIFDPVEVDENIDLGKEKELEVDIKSKTRAAKGTYSKRAGVILYTPDKLYGLPIGHAAMIYNQNYVYESNPNTGVKRGPNNWYSSKSQAYCLGVKGTSVAQDAAAAEYCKKKVNYPYNWEFYKAGKRDSFYCSHLVAAAYWDVNRVNLDTKEWSTAIHPSELLSGPNTVLLYRKK